MINYELLRAVRDYILEEPRRAHMDAWLASSPQSPCGTVGCIAGWTVYLKRQPFTDFDIVTTNFSETAQELLGIDRYQARMLFFTGYWPDNLRHESYKHAPGTEDYAKVIAARIDLFIESGGML